MTSHFVWASRTTPLQNRGRNCVRCERRPRAGALPFQIFCSAKFSTCIAVRLLKFSVLHGKGESKYRPVATNFQCLKNCCPLSHPCWGVPSPNPAPASHRWCECGVSFYIALSIPERAFIIFTGGRIWLK